jgi:hypothetical protein
VLRGGLRHDVLRIEGGLLSMRGFVRFGVVMLVTVVGGCCSDL